MRTNKRAAPAQTGENAAHRPLAALLEVQRGQEVGENGFLLVELVRRAGSSGLEGLDRLDRLAWFFSLQHFADLLKIKRNIFIFIFLLLCTFRPHAIHALHVRNRAQKRLERVQHFLPIRSLRLRFDNPVDVLLAQIPFLCLQSLAELLLVHFHPLQLFFHPSSARPFHLASPSQQPGNREFPRSLKLSQRSIASQRDLQLFFFFFFIVIVVVVVLLCIASSIRPLPQIRSDPQSAAHFERSAPRNPPATLPNLRRILQIPRYRARFPRFLRLFRRDEFQKEELRQLDGRDGDRRGGRDAVQR